jgi:hypothetical protein
MADHEEIEEHIHHAHEPFDKVVAGSMAFIAALLAIVSVLGQHYNTEVLLDQQQASDQWAFFQAKNIRHYSAQMGRDVLTQLKGTPDAITGYAKDMAHFESDMREEKTKAEELEKERDKAEGKAKRFHSGEVLLEIGIVLSSLAILTKRKPFFAGGVCTALAGALYAATAFV